MSSWKIVGAALALIALIGTIWLMADGRGGDSPQPGEEPVSAHSDGLGIPALIIGGGSTPENNQVQIEQDVAMAAQVLGSGAKLLYAAGPGSHGVQVLNSAPKGDPLRLRLAEIFSPRGGRDSSYRKTTLRPTGPATLEATEAAIADALPGSGSTIIMFIGHGDRGESPNQNSIRLWGGWPLSVVDLATLLDAAPPERRTIVVSTTCISGGMAELIYRGADGAQGPSEVDRCGLFASPWDLVATGCDPDPNRRAQEGYGLHFLGALKGQDRDGQALPLATLDLDKDGRISLLEAHTRVRIASRSGDVPTTTSERWLRHVGLVAGSQADVALPEEDAVIEAMARQLGLAGKVETARGMFEAAEQTLSQTDADVRAAREREDEEAARVAAALLARWPVLDDPWHPDHAVMLTTHHAAIGAFLGQSPEYERFQKALEATARLTELLSKQELAIAPLERLIRALDNKALAGRLAARGGPEWERFQALLACERTAAQPRER